MFFFYCAVINIIRFSIDLLALLWRERIE